MTTTRLSGRRLSALIVNHNSGAWTERCAASLRRAWEAEAGDPIDLEIIVLDSGSEKGEATWWRTLRRGGVRVRTSPANVGYATGLNMAYELSSGKDQDIVALLNPDMHFLPGSLGPLVKRLDEDSSVGAVQPRIYLDEDLQILLPPNELPSPGAELLEALASHFTFIARWRADRKRRSSEAFWSSTAAQEREMLSGACLFLRRSTIEELGEAMDGRFPLYFEDADLCLRLREHGYSLALEPDSEILHHWSRCAGPEFAGEVATRHAYSRSLYMSKHHRGIGSVLAQMCSRALGNWKRSDPTESMHSLLDLGELYESPTFDLPANVRGTLEISLTPFWGLSAGSWIEGGPFQFSPKAWSWLFPGEYFVRAVASESGELLGAWKFQKTSPARTWPLDDSCAERTAHNPWRQPRHGERVG